MVYIKTACYIEIKRITTNKENKHADKFSNSTLVLIFIGKQAAISRAWSSSSQGYPLRPTLLSRGKLV